MTRFISLVAVLAFGLIPSTLFAQSLAGPGGALSFDGAKSYVQVSSNASLALNNHATFEAWVFPSSQPAGTIISRGDGGNGALTDYIMQLANMGGVLKLGFFTTNGWDYSTGTVPTNTWTHVAVTYDGTNKLFYINGVLDTTANRPGGLFSSGSPVFIGRQGSVCGCNLFKGTMDEVRVWNTVRTASQISQNFKQTLAGTEAGLAAYYKFDYIFGIIAQDSSTNRNTGTLFNRPVPVPSTVPFPLYFALANPFTNSCNVPYVDPGATVSGAPFGLAASDGYSLALRPDGTPLVWLENGTITNPVFVTNLIAFSYSDSGTGIGLRTNGSVLAWNSSSLLSVPANVTNVVAIGLSPQGFELALRADGTLVGWGYNGDNETNIPANATNVVAIAVGSHQALALKADGTLGTWGANLAGQQTIPPSATNVVGVAADNNGNCSIALRADGSVLVWGDNSAGQTNIPSSATNVVSIAAGTKTIVAARADGTVVSWGLGLSGQTNIPPQATNIVAVAVSAFELLLQRADGTLLVGTTDFLSEKLPTNIYALQVPVSAAGTVNPGVSGNYTITYSATNAAHVTGTTNRTVVVADVEPPGITLLGGNPLVWTFGVPFVDPGATAFDQCNGDETAGIVAAGAVNINVPGVYRRSYTVADPAGNSRTMVRDVIVQPAQTLFLFGPNPQHLECTSGTFNPPAGFVFGSPFGVFAGGNDSYAIAVGRGIQAWGDANAGETTIPSNATNVITIAGGSDFALALRADGSVVGWGFNGDGETNVPASATNVTAIAAGSSFGLALGTNGTVVGWGDDTYGEIDIPANAVNVIALAAGYAHSVALKADGTVVAWGDDSTGETDVAADATNIVAISAEPDGSYTLALKANGHVIGWGDNSAGQLNIPASATNVVAVAAGAGHSLALKADGTVVAWGNNTYGQTNVPANATNVVAIAAGGNHCLALTAGGTILGWGLNDLGQVGGIPTPIQLDKLNLPVTSNNPVSFSSLGTNQVIYMATNTSGNLITNVRVVIVSDDMPPNLTVLGDNPLQFVAGTPFVDPGVTAIDQCAGDLTSSVVVTGAVNNNAPGIYNLTYSITDPSGNSATNNRTVVVVAAPSVSGLASSFVATNAGTAIVTVQLSANVNPNGLPTMAYIQFGLNTSYSAPMPLTTNLPGVYVASNIVAVAPSLSRAVVYHWRVVGSNSVGTTASPDQLLPVPGLYAAGDLNGDGIVSIGELNSVLSNYFSTSPFLMLTNVAGLGQSNVTFQLTNSLEGAFSVEVSTDLLSWQTLGAAVPLYEFTDTNAATAPKRYYRLRWP